MTHKVLLYDRKLESMRRQWEEVKNNDKVARERELEWEWGEMGREANNEGNLADRGFGER